MPPLAGFVGPTYQSQDASVDLERAINIYPEISQANGKAKIVFYGTPGLNLFCTLPGGQHRGAYALDNRAWMVSDSHIFEIFANGTFIDRGNVGSDGLPVTMSATGNSVVSPGAVQPAHQLFIVSAGTGFILDQQTNVLTPLAGTPGFPTTAVVMGAVYDDIFVALTIGNFQISLPNDGLTWRYLLTQGRSQGSDNFVAVVQSLRALWLLGSFTSEVWYDSGDPNFPFAPIPGIFIEEGIAAKFSITRGFDNAPMWLGQNYSGGRVVRRANGYIPQRISTHGVEAQFDSYSRVDDAVGYTYREGGHEFYVLTFPSAQATWAYDAATQMWAERAFLNPATGQQEAHLGISHCFAFGNKHLVGSRINGQVFEQSLKFATDNGYPIRSTRRAPYIGGGENHWLYHHQLELLFGPGLGLVETNIPTHDPMAPNSGPYRAPPPFPRTQTPQGVAPMAMLKWSDDGHTFGTEYSVELGAQGRFDTRAIWRRLGRSRYRVYEVSVSDPIRRAWIEVFLTATPGLH